MTAATRRTSPETLPQIPLAVDAVGTLLANERRRAVIAVVGELDPEQSLTMSDLAYATTARLTGTPQAELTADQVQSIHSSLWQTHLDPLIAHDVLTEHGEYYRPGPAAAPLAAWLDAITTACPSDEP